ncbi:MAG: hypothetical protein IT350_12335 [Deltaproteobacteria bacterium]|nr:hypothetical protein [Deltaproteobacteria bacterium]
MKRVCTACHAVSDIDGDTCPRCGGNAVTLDAWRNLRAQIPPAGAPSPASPNPTEATTVRLSMSKPSGRGEAERGDGTAFVLGMFLSFLCFAIAFITVYVVIDWIG